MRVRCNYSGGKDSQTACDLHILQGDDISVVTFIPMLTEDIPMLTKRHYEFILAQHDRFRIYGDVHIVTGMNYYDYAVANGYVGFKVCGYRNDVKIPALNSVHDDSDYIDIGIAYDEVKRHKQLNYLKRSILVENKYTEMDCFVHCYKRDRLSPHYLLSTRDGCILCPNGSQLTREIWLSDYPQAREILLELDYCIKSRFHDDYLRYPLRDYQNFFDWI